MKLINFRGTGLIPKLLAVALVLRGGSLLAQVPPAISAQPQSQTALAGTEVTFNVAVTGTGPFTYQWQFNGTNVSSEIISTVAGNGSTAYFGDSGPATRAGLNSPYGVAADASGNLFIAGTYDNRIRKVDAQGVITTIAGNGASAYAGDGGMATNASLWGPSCVAVDAAGNLFIGDASNYRVRKVDLHGVITTVAGNGAQGYSGDGGAATNASLSAPYAVAVDAFDNLYIVDAGNNRIRKVDASGIITTAAGDGSRDYSGDGGAATNAGIYPNGLAVDVSGNMFIADANNRIRKVDVNGMISTVAGNGTNGSTSKSGDDGAATNASLSGPLGVAVDVSGNLFFSEAGRDRLRKIPLGGLPTLTIDNVSVGNAGDYQAIITSPYGSVTSAVARLTVVLPPVIVMNAPIISANNLVLGFSLSQGASTSSTLLQAPSITGQWMTNTSAVLTTNIQTGFYQFSIPAPTSDRFYKLHSP